MLDADPGVLDVDVDEEAENIPLRLSIMLGDFNPLAPFPDPETVDVDVVAFNGVAVVDIADLRTSGSDEAPVAPTPPIF